MMRVDVAVEPRRLHDVDVRGMAVRFGFGFGISVMVGIVTLVAGDRVGGLFLAFPAILPASLTLIAKEDGNHSAKVDAAGAVLGGIALTIFGAVSWVLLAHTDALVAEVAALVAWTTGAVGLYLAVRRRIRA